jgi:DNA-binding transcriptional MerR regulator
MELNVNEAARRAGIHPHTLAKYARQGRVTCRLNGGKRLYDMSALPADLEQINAESSANRSKPRKMVGSAPASD